MKIIKNIDEIIKSIVWEEEQKQMKKFFFIFSWNKILEKFYSSKEVKYWSEKNIKNIIEIIN